MIKLGKYCSTYGNGTPALLFYYQDQFENVSPTAWIINENKPYVLRSESFAISKSSVTALPDYTAALKYATIHQLLMAYRDYKNYRNRHDI